MLSILLLYIGEPGRNHSYAGSGCHPIYGFAVDRSSRRNVSLCHQNVARVSHNLHTESPIYISISNHLQIFVNSDAEHKSIIRVEGTITLSYTLIMISICEVVHHRLSVMSVEGLESRQVAPCFPSRVFVKVPHMP